MFPTHPDHLSSLRGLFAQLKERPGLPMAHQVVADWAQESGYPTWADLIRDNLQGPPTGYPSRDDRVEWMKTTLCRLMSVLSFAENLTPVLLGAGFLVQSKRWLSSYLERPHASPHCLPAKFLTLAARCSGASWNLCCQHAFQAVSLLEPPLLWLVSKELSLNTLRAGIRSDLQPLPSDPLHPTRAVLLRVPDLNETLARALLEKGFQDVVLERHAQVGTGLDYHLFSRLGESPFAFRRLPSPEPSAQPFGYTHPNNSWLAGLLPHLPSLRLAPKDLPERWQSIPRRRRPKTQLVPDQASLGLSAEQSTF